MVSYTFSTHKKLERKAEIMLKTNSMRIPRLAVVVLTAVACLSGDTAGAADQENASRENAGRWVVYEGGDGPGKGKHIVFVTGDEEYRSEESMPQLAKIAARRLGFKCTVLFAINKEDGTIDPMTLDNIPGLENLEDADLMVMFVRFRLLPPKQMKHILNYINSGKPMISLRTNTHPFNYPAGHQFYQWTWNNKAGGFGARVFGQTWINHHGDHHGTSTRAIVVPEQAAHPVFRGVNKTFWGPSDVYGTLPLHGKCTTLVMGQVTEGKSPDGKPQEGKIQMPLVWTKTYTGTSTDTSTGGKPARVLTTTMGHSFDLKSEDLRRLLINACFWCMGLEDKIPAKADVGYVGRYNPSDIGYGKCKKGLKPSDHKL